jgi:hypothetical protein
MGYDAHTTRTSAGVEVSATIELIEAYQTTTSATTPTAAASNRASTSLATRPRAARAILTIPTASST